MSNVTPKDLSALATQVWRAQQNLQRWKNKIAPIEEATKALEQELLDALLANKLESVASKQATISVKRNEFVELYDDKEFFEYVRRNNYFDLVRKQPVLSACQARWENNVPVPGCRRGVKAVLSVTTRKSAIRRTRALRPKNKLK